jgi:hypothetical protein
MGLRAHSGWAVLVAVGGTATAPAVIQRRRIELADRGISGSVQPYHAAQPMTLEEAKAFLDRCADTTRAMARKELTAAVAEIAEQGYEIVGSCILLSSGRTTTELAAILASHAAIHTAEGDFFREALRSACESCGVTVSGVKERDLFGRTAAALHLAPDRIEARLSEMGKVVGPPWRQDEKLSALASWLVLADSAK